MTREDTLSIMAVLKAAYPNYYRDMKRADAESVVDLWSTMFADEPAELVAMAVKAHIASDVKGFPPHIGAIKDAIVKLMAPPALEMSELEAWNLVKRAITGATMSDDSRRMLPCGTMGPPIAVRKFNDLPPILQRLVGSPKQLADWYLLPDNEINTITQSNFMRSFRARAAQEREMLALPKDVRAGMERLAEGMKLQAITDGRAVEI